MKIIPQSSLVISNEKIEELENGRLKETQKEITADNYPKQQQGKVVFWLMIIATLVIAYQNFIMFLLRVREILITTNSIVSTFAILTLGYKSIRLAINVKDYLCMVFLLDNIFISWTAAIVGYVGIMYVAYPMSIPAPPIFTSLSCVYYTLFAATYRLSLARCQWQRYQVIAVKITILLSCLAYLILAIYYMSNDLQSQIQNAPVQMENHEGIKQFFFLFVFGMFTLYLQIYAKVTDVDGTGDFKYSYQIGARQELREQLLEQNQMTTLQHPQDKKRNIKLHPLHINKNTNKQMKQLEQQLSN